MNGFSDDFDPVMDVSWDGADFDVNHIDHRKALTWGDWTFDPDSGVLSYRTGLVFAVDLTDIDNAQAYVNLVSHVRRKDWFTAQVLSDFLHALEDLLRPQEHLAGRNRFTAPRGTFRPWDRP